MRLVFMGTPEFAVPSLEALVRGKWEIQAVITQPDRPRGRGQRMQYSPIKEVAREAGLEVLQPEKASNPAFVEELKVLDPDAIVVVAFGQLIPPSILDMPTYGCINVHPSLLPRYRGASPIQQAIIDGCRKTGVTTMLLDQGWDTGDILLQEEVDITPEDTAETLEKRLAKVGARLLVNTLDRLAKGTLESRSQDDSQATYAYKLTKEAGQISWDATTDEIINLIRGVTPWPGAFTFSRGTLLKVWEVAEVPGEKTDAPSGTVLGVRDDGIIVATGSGSISLRVVQPPNRSRMGGRDYANGYHIDPGEILGGSLDGA